MIDVELFIVGDHFEVVEDFFVLICQVKQHQSPPRLLQHIDIGLRLVPFFFILNQKSWVVCEEHVVVLIEQQDIIERHSLDQSSTKRTIFYSL